MMVPIEEEVRKRRSFLQRFYRPDKSNCQTTTAQHDKWQIRPLPIFITGKGEQEFCYNQIMSKIEDLQRVIESGIVAVIRAKSSELLVDVAEALLAGGVLWIGK